MCGLQGKQVSGRGSLHTALSLVSPSPLPSSRLIGTTCCHFSGLHSIPIPSLERTRPEQLETLGSPLWGKVLRSLGAPGPVAGSDAADPAGPSSCRVRASTGAGLFFTDSARKWLPGLHPQGPGHRGCSVWLSDSKPGGKCGIWGRLLAPPRQNLGRWGYKQVPVPCAKHRFILEPEH